MAKRLSIRCPFDIDLPPLMSEAEKEYLTACLRYGMATEQDVEDLFMAHIRIALSIVGNYHKAKHLISDLVQAAMLAIAKAINKAPDAMIDNQITPYIAKWIRYSIKDAIGAQHLIPPRTYRHKKARDPNFQGIYYSTPDLPRGAKRDLDDDEWVKLKDNKVNLTDQVIDFGGRIVEIMEAIDFCINQDDNLKRREYKRAIIQLRTAGYANHEIGDMLDVSKSYVQGALSDIEKKFNNLSKGQ